ncbi:MAG: hypothetical protein PF447_11690 [Spirochaetaceae bacterium]|jgi:hypothetical protein|nr:hypothetical protein [Spirochaetaceae bacterium]
MKCRLFLLVLSISVLIFSCDIFGGNSSGITEPGLDLEDNILDIPQSLLPGSSLVTSYSRAAIQEDHYAGLYNLIPEYIGSAENIRSMVEDIVTSLIENKEWIDVVDKDTRLDADGGSDFAQYSVEELDAGGDYDVRINLFESAEDSSPSFVIDYYMDPVSLDTRGRIVLTEDGFFEGTSTVDSLAKRLTAEILFDGISDTKSLEVNYFESLGAVDTDDNTTLIGYARGLDSSANETELLNLDLGQPERMSISVTFDGSYYRVSGYSYHPGIEVMQEKGMDSFYEMFNPGDEGTRHSYLFKAMVSVDNSGEEQGAKLYLSFPEDIESDVTRVWTEDALGGFYTDFLTQRVNEYMLDPDEDGTPLEDEEYGEILFMNLWLKDRFSEIETTTTAPTVSQWTDFQSWVDLVDTAVATNYSDANSNIEPLIPGAVERAGSLRWEDIQFLAMLGDGINLYTSDSVPLDETNWTSFRNFMDNDIIPITAYSQAEIQAAWSGYNEDMKQNLFLMVNISNLVDSAVADINAADSTDIITSDELQTFLAQIDLDEDAQAFANLFSSVQYIVNPAFYSPAAGFIGTYNEELEQYYSLSVSTLEPTSTPGVMTDLNALDDSSVETLVPQDELDKTILFL